MEKFIELGQQYLQSHSQENVNQQPQQHHQQPQPRQEQYGDGDGGYGVTGGHQYNSPDNQPPAGYQGGGGQGYGGGQQGYGGGGQQGYGGGGQQGYGGGGQRPDRPQFDENEVVNTASEQGSGDPSMFSSALSFLGNHSDQHEQPINEEHVTNAYQQAYGQGNASSLSASSMGSAAALQALKGFTSGGGSGGLQSQLISTAMAEATKLFDGAGGAASGNKQDCVNSAAMTVMKLLVQSKFSSMTGGGNSGGLGGIMGLASKFM
ncbi:hypothetical protein BC835DRAFT_1337942 [Cytidiella melzeri]|nr:hypothetical protein BC835DRAFT_1337942 [Cytidiella melzeri]